MTIQKTNITLPIRLGILGTGRIASRFVQDAMRQEAVQIICVYNPHITSAKKFVEQVSDGDGVTAPQYTDDLARLAEQVEAVYIAAPHETHYEYAKTFLRHGIHVLCEKPMTFSKAQAEDLFALAKKQGCVLMEAIKTAYCPGFLAMMEMAQSGKLGEILDVEACFSRLTPTNLREMTDMNYGGSVTEFGSYVLLPILRLMGTNYKDITFHSVNAANGVDIYTKTTLEYERGTGLGKTGLGVKSEGQLVIAGTKGYILAESPWWLTKKFEVRFEASNKREVHTYPFEPCGLQYELEEFVRRIQEVRKGCVDNADVSRQESIAMADIMERFLAQAKESRKKALERAAERSGSQADTGRVKFWAHRGCSFAYPENTLEAFAAAAKLLGIAGIELDVQLTKDGEVVVFHDENVSRITDGTKEVREYTLEELKLLHIQADGGATAVIPTLEEVLTLLEPYCKADGLQINIELKTGVVRYEGIEKKTMQLVQRHGLEPYIVYSSFLADSIGIVKELDSTAKTGMLAYLLTDCIEGARQTNADALHPCVAGMDCILPEDMKEMPVRAWNGDEPLYWNKEQKALKERHLEKYAMFGVTELFTNVAERYVLKKG